MTSDTSAPLTATASPGRAAIPVGLALSALLAAIASLAAPRLMLPPLLLAILLGMAVRAALPGLCAGAMPGIVMAAKKLLRVGVALLGLRLALPTLMGLGPRAALLVALSLPVTVIAGYGIARLLRQRADSASVAATSVAVCGASAALAAGSVAPPRAGLDRDTGAVVILVSLLSTAAMIVYPRIADALRLDDLGRALLLGGAIHDVAQVVGAAGDPDGPVAAMAMAVKLMRVALLLPLVLLWRWHWARTTPQTANGGGGAPFPWFLVGFVAAAAVAASGLLPAAVLSAGQQVSGWLLAMSVAALGLMTAPADLAKVSWRLALAVLATSLVQLGVVLALVGQLA